MMNAFITKGMTIELHLSSQNIASKHFLCNFWWLKTSKIKNINFRAYLELLSTFLFKLAYSWIKVNLFQPLMQISVLTSFSHMRHQKILCSSWWSVVLLTISSWMSNHISQSWLRKSFWMDLMCSNKSTARLHPMTTWGTDVVNGRLCSTTI